MAEIKIFGYTDKISVKQGDNINFHVSADGTQFADAQLVRLIHGDAHPDGPGFSEEEIDNQINGEWKVEKQFTQLGSFLKVNDPENKLIIVETDGFLSLTGAVNESKIDQIFINGEEEAIESDNTFTHILNVPSNGLEVRVVANKDGQKAESLKFNIQVGF